MLKQTPPAPFTERHKPKDDDTPNLPIDQYCNYFILIAIVLGFLSMNYKRLIK